MTRIRFKNIVTAMVVIMLNRAKPVNMESSIIGGIVSDNWYTGRSKINYLKDIQKQFFLEFL